MKAFTKSLNELSVTTRLSLLVSGLLIFAIITTIGNALTRQNDRTQAAVNMPRGSQYSITCAPRPECLDAIPACDIPELEIGWCPKEQ